MVVASDRPFRWAYGALSLVCVLSAAVLVAAPLAPAMVRASSCPRVQVLASRGSGDVLGKNEGLGAPGLALTTALNGLVSGVAHWANPYGAVGVFSWNRRKLAPDLGNAVGAASKISGFGAYSASVLGGEKDLVEEVSSLAQRCQAQTKIVLVGYSQGAQLAADVYQSGALSSAQRGMVAAVVLFGDPYFNGGNRTVDRGSFSGRRDGILGSRAAFTGSALVLSYCHSHDPICQGLFFRVGPMRTVDPGALTFRQHLNYTSFGEPQQAAALVSKLLPVGGADATKAKSTSGGFRPAHVWTWQEVSGGGYRFWTRLEAGAFTRLAAAPVLPGFSTRAAIVSGCAGFEPETDAVVPLSIQMRNETAHFSTTLTTTLYGLLGNYLQPWVSTAYSNGITCEQPGVRGYAQGWSIQWSGTTRPGAFSGVVYAYMVLHDYYTPKHPRGDPSVIRWAAFQIPGYYISDQRTVTSITLDGKPAAKIVNGSIPALQTPVGPSPCCIIPLTGKPVH